MLWIATWVLAFLGAYGAPDVIGAESSLSNFVIGDLVLVPTVLGAVAGALSINVLLWLMDRFGGTSMDSDTIEELTDMTEEQNGGTDPGDSNQQPR